MTIKVGDEVQVFRGSYGWDSLVYTVLAIQDCDPQNIPERKWVVIAFKSDIPKVYHLYEVRKVPTTKVVVKNGVMDQNGSVYINEGILGLTDVPVRVHCTEVDGVVDLTYPYTVERK